MTRKLSWIFGGLGYLGFVWPLIAEATLNLGGYEMMVHIIFAFFLIVIASSLASLFGAISYLQTPQPRPFRRRIELFLLTAPLGIAMVLFLMS